MRLVVISGPSIRRTGFSRQIWKKQYLVSKWTLTLRGDSPWCLACLFDWTVEHCVYFTNAHDDFYCVTLTSVSELFSKVASRSIINFIKGAGFYRKMSIRVFT